MPDVYRDEAALLKDFNRLSQEYRNKAGRYIKNLLKLQRAENGLQGIISMHEFEQKRAANEQNDDKVIRCSFCGKPQADAEQIIAGSNVYICDACVRLCARIIEEIDEKKQQVQPTEHKGGAGT